MIAKLMCSYRSMFGLDADVALADVQNEKKSSFVKAWEESEKTKAHNK